MTLLWGLNLLRSILLVRSSFEYSDVISLAAISLCCLKNKLSFEFIER